MSKIHLALTIAALSAASACDSGPPGDLSGRTAIASCVYVNPFSEIQECREYLGDNWDLQKAEQDCAAQEGAVFTTGDCGLAGDEIFGDCVFNDGTEDVYRVRVSDDPSTDCEGAEVGCEVFGGGAFAPSETCGGLPDRDLQQGLVYINPELICEEVDGAEQCTWDSIHGCSPAGVDFQGNCENVRSQRGYYETDEDTFETPADDPIFRDQAYLDELAWVTEQVESCGCVCCHDSDRTPQGASNWNIRSDKPVWTDGFYPSGLAFAAGWVDSSLLGSLPAEDNNEFGRVDIGVPTTDAERMRAFFEGEAVRRGLSREDFAGVAPVPSVFYQQQIFEPSACENGQGITRDGQAVWSGGDARYIYLLEPDAENPLTPPNFDEPEGTLWLLEVRWDEDAMTSGLSYPSGPPQASQRIVGPALDSLVEGDQYYMYVWADVGAPITRCLFTF